MRKTRIGKLLAAALVTAALAAFGTTAWADTWNGQTPSERPDGYVADDSKKNCYDFRCGGVGVAIEGSCRNSARGECRGKHAASVGG